MMGLSTKFSKFGTKKSLAIIALPFAMSACEAIGDSPVPGMGDNYLSVSESDILAAAKCQIAQGIVAVDNLKTTKYSSDSRAAAYEFKKGSGTSSGQYQLVRTRSGEIKAVIPTILFSGWGGTYTPSFGGSAKSTAVQMRTRNFDINPKGVDSSDLEICNQLKLKGINPGTFISDEIVSSFETLMNVPIDARDGKSYGPIFTNTIIQFDTAFTIEYTRKGGLAEAELVPAGADLDMLKPSATSTRVATNVYKLSIKLPTKTNDPSDTRRIYYTLTRGGESLTVEEPYTRERFQELQEQLKKASAFSSRSLTNLRLGLPGDLEGLTLPEGEDLTDLLAEEGQGDSVEFPDQQRGPDF